MTRSTVTALILTLLSTMTSIVDSNADVHSDKREIIFMNEADINYLLKQMHGFMVTIQQVTEGMEDDDFNQIINAAKASGTAAVKHVPEDLKATLPMEFKKLGYATRKTFDQLAMDAEQFADKDHTLSQLNQVLTLCTDCHARFRVE